MDSPEFSHVLSVARLTTTPRWHRLVADESERAALARRFDLLSIERLEADLEVWRTASGAHAVGPMVARVVQRCVVSGEPVPARVETKLELRFEPEGEQAVEMDPAAEMTDILPLENDAIDLGEAVAQSLALALDPWPRAGAAALAAARRHLMTEEEAATAHAALKAAASPFSALKTRKP